jgi:cation:H+ antiporter
MLPERKGPAGKRDLLWFLIAAALPVPWVAAHALGGLGLQPEATAVLAGLAILGAAFLLSWSMELAERDIPQSLALLVLALVSVLPEYAVDLHFAITAASDPTYAHYAVANMTGANRLLIGLGWAAVVLIACRKSGASELAIEPKQGLEIRFLILATVYSFFIPLNGRLGLVDAAVLLLLFAAYVRAAMKGESHDEELMGPAALVDLEFADLGRRVWAVLFFVFGGYAIFVAAEPFAEGLVHIGRNYAVDEFLLVQWVAPLASESPEFIVAILFALRMRGSLGIGALISSKVNQWTLLVGALPVAFVLAGGASQGLPLDARQTEELFLTSAQSLLAALLICNLSFSRTEAIILAALFGVQLVFPSTEVRVAFAVLYIAIFLGMMIHSPERRRRFFSYLRLGSPAPGTVPDAP